MIRAATHEDIPQMVALGKLMHAESIFAAYDFDEAKTTAHIATLIDLRSGIALVAEHAGKVVGGFIGAVHPHWFGNDTVATDYALFLAPEHRVGRIGIRLVLAYVQAALDRQAKQIMLANSTGYHPDRVAKLFEGLGFRRLGYVFELT